MRRFANPEAVVSFGNALGLVPDVPSGAARDERELALRLAIGPALLAARGYASTEVERNYQEAGTLADRLGDREAVFTSTRGLWHYFYDRGELEQALTLAERLMAIGELDGSVERMSLALRAVGSTLMSKGDFAGALHAFDRCLAEGARTMRGASLARHGEEPQVVALQYKGLVLALQGLLDSGLSTAQEAVAQAEALNFPLIVPFASTILGLILLMRRDFVACAALSSRQLEFCAEHGFVFWSAAHQVLRGAARAHLDGSPEGLAETEAGIRNWGRTGAALHIPTWSCLLAEAALAVGDLEVAEKALSNKREQAERRGELYAMAELLRLEGRIDAHRGRADRGLPSLHRGGRCRPPPRRRPLFAASQPRPGSAYGEDGERDRSARPSRAGQLRRWRASRWSGIQRGVRAPLGAGEGPERSRPDEFPLAAQPSRSGTGAGTAAKGWLCPFARPTMNDRNLRSPDGGVDVSLPFAITAKRDPRHFSLSDRPHETVMAETGSRVADCGGQRFDRGRDVHC